MNRRDEFDAQIISLYTIDKLSQAKIANQLKISIDLISRVLKKYSITIRARKYNINDN